MHKIVILGSGETASLYSHKEGDTVWCPLSIYNKNMEGKDILFFAMHKEQAGAKEGVVDLNNYPIDEIIDLYGSRYFTNTISYMIAFALYKGVDQIDLFGVDMNGLDEYYNQRASVMYWIGYARAKGVMVNLASEIDQPSFLYGYEDSKNVKKKIDLLKRWAIREKNNTKDNNTRQQYAGFLYALESIKREL